MSNEPEIVRDFHIDMPAVLRLAGLVVQKAPGDQPVAGAIVEGQPYGSRSARSRFISVADARGRFHAERYRDQMMIVARSPDDSLAGLTFIGEDDMDIRVPISAAATVSGRMTRPDGKPFAEQSVSCRIAVDPPNQAKVQGFPPGIVRRVLTDAEGRFTFAGIPVGTRCTVAGNLKIGETSHRGSADIVATKPGSIARPDLVLHRWEPATNAK